MSHHPTPSSQLTFGISNFLFPVDSRWGKLEWGKEGNNFHSLSVTWKLALYVIKLQQDTVLVSEASAEGTEQH